MLDFHAPLFVPDTARYLDWRCLSVRKVHTCFCTRAILRWIPSIDREYLLLDLPLLWKLGLNRLIENIVRLPGGTWPRRCTGDVLERRKLRIIIATGFTIARAWFSGTLRESSCGIAVSIWCKNVDTPCWWLMTLVFTVSGLFVVSLVNTDLDRLHRNR